MKNHNAAVYLLASRVGLLEKSLGKFYENWNHKYDYPVHVHFFNNIFSNKEIRSIKKNVSANVFFHPIDYAVPPGLDERELFFNRTDIRYVRRSFPASRIGYLHMQRFVTHLTGFGEVGCVSQALAKYDYLMRIDDDSHFKLPINYDLFDVLEEYPFATGYTWNHFDYRVEGTRQKLWEFYKAYLSSGGYVPKNAQLRRAIETNDESLMHALKWSAGNLNLYNLKRFKECGWLEYQDRLSRYCGDYKYRWGDIETIGLFAYTHFPTGVYDLGLREVGVYSDRWPEAVGNYAPFYRQSEEGLLPRLKGFRRHLPSWMGRLRKKISRGNQQ